MQFKSVSSFFRLICCAGFMGTPAMAQTSFTACESQHSLEQVFESDGTILPDDCREATIAQLESNGRTLCLMDLSRQDGGLMDDLRDVAAVQEWWVDCTALTEQAGSAP